MSMYVCVCVCAIACAHLRQSLFVLTLRILYFKRLFFLHSFPKKKINIVTVWCRTCWRWQNLHMHLESVIYLPSSFFFHRLVSLLFFGNIGKKMYMAQCHIQFEFMPPICVYIFLIDYVWNAQYIITMFVRCVIFCCCCFVASSPAEHSFDRFVHMG